MNDLMSYDVYNVLYNVDIINNIIANKANNYILFFYKEDFIENEQKRRLTKTIYRAMYKMYIQSTTNFKIQTLFIIKKLL